MILLYGYPPSGNCWKVAQILEFTRRPYRWVVVNSNRGETQTPEFLSRFPIGKVPVVELEDGTRLSESGAILTHFAENTPWLPAPGIARTRVMEWLFFEQYSHEPYIAVARNIVSFLGQKEAQAERLAACRIGGEKALTVMERRLSDHPWLTDAGPTIADIALCAYTQVADQGEFELALWPGVEAWVRRMQAVPNFLTLPRV
jgi:glutathione S-transferase